MIDKRLLSLIKDKIYLIIVIGTRLVSLFISIAFYFFIIQQLTSVQRNTLDNQQLSFFIFMSLAFIFVKALLNRVNAKTAFQASSILRLTIRERILKKVVALGTSVQFLTKPTTLTQLSVEGVEQLDVYYARFIPQFFYSMIAALVVFITLSFYRWQAACILLLGAVLIPVSIMIMVKIAKKILGNYWDSYLNLGEQFFENIKGLTTLKVYGQDQFQHDAMNKTAQSFRKATMRLLTMQLNSITIMDTIVYAGSATGIALALLAYQQQVLSLTGLLLFILLSAEFFIPLRQLGSLFHVAMTGMSASDRLFSFLELPEPKEGDLTIESHVSALEVKHLTFSYPEQAPTLYEIDVTFERGKLYAIVGASGSGKSTLTHLLSRALQGYQGSIHLDGLNLTDIQSQSFNKHLELVNAQSYLKATTVRENLTLGLGTVAEEGLWDALRQVNLESFVREQAQGLDYELEENGKNLSGGQRQRLLIARAILHQKSIYIFDEMSASVDRESEIVIMQTLKKLAKTHIVIFISHRLYTAQQADHIYVLAQGQLVQSGSPKILEESEGYFATSLRHEANVLQGKEQPQ